jgi:hypothetical protein
MIFDTIRYGTFTADDFINAHNTNDFTKFTALPIDIRKKFISDMIDLHPNKENKNFKQAAFDLIDGKIIEDQFRNTWLKYWSAMPGGAGSGAVAAVVAVAAGAAVAAVAVVVSVHEYYRPQLEQHAKHLNKVIQEYK